MENEKIVSLDIESLPDALYNQLLQAFQEQYGLSLSFYEWKITATASGEPGITAEDRMNEIKAEIAEIEWKASHAGLNPTDITEAYDDLWAELESLEREVL